MFTHLQTHSAYSLLYGPRRVEELVDAAAAAGCRALALTDIDNLYGVHGFLAACRARGIRPIVGAEIRHGGERAVLLCRDRRGFENLCLLLTERKRQEDFSLARGLRARGEGSFVLTDSPSLLRSLAGSVEGLHALVTPFSRAGAFLARRLRIPAAAAGEAAFLDAGDYRIHRVLRAVAGRRTVFSVSPEDCAPPGALLFPPGAAPALFAGFPEALENNEKIADACRFDVIFQGFVFPPARLDLLGGAATPEEALRDQVLRGAEERYGEVGDGLMERIEYELGIIRTKGFTDYFLVVADIVRRAARTCGRGSAAASVVSYCLGITNVDPIRCRLYFERFLNPRREDPPDIDIDFPWDERDGVIAQVMERYGADHAARICNHNHFARRGALRETARAYGIPDEETGARERLLRRGGAEPDETWAEILSVAERIRGLPRHLGVHSGGIVLTPRPLASYVPVETAAMGVPVVTWEKDGTEAAGLVKIDLLGNRSLAVIRDALASIREGGLPFPWGSWDPQQDEPTRDLLARGDTMGVFYIESPAMRRLQQKTRKGDFDHIVIHSSIIRPAANRYINDYVRRLRGEAWEPLHPALDELLADTCGIMVYQEDVSKAASAIAGFSDADADGLRKIMSKKNKEARLAEYRRMFFAGAGRNGVSPEQTEKIWSMILSFDGYSFCKPHSASYAMVSFQSAYLKAHYPGEFMAAVISNRGGYYTTAAYVGEARRMGLRILPPDLNESFVPFTGRGRDLRVGLQGIRGLRRETGERITAEREKGGPFADLEDFRRRIPLCAGEAEALTSAGAADSLGGRHEPGAAALGPHRSRDSFRKRLRGHSPRGQRGAGGREREPGRRP